MPKFADWSAAQEVKDIAERYLETFPAIFEGFNLDLIHFVMTKKKKSKEPIKVHAVGYPAHLFMHPYVVETFQTWWKDMTPKQKNLAVWRAMCRIPNSGFDELAKLYGRKLQPEIQMFMMEYAACGGVPNWMDNPAAQDPMSRTAEEVKKSIPQVEVIPGKKADKTPVTADDIAEAGEGE